MRNLNISLNRRIGASALTAILSACGAAVYTNSSAGLWYWFALGAIAVFAAVYALYPLLHPQERRVRVAIGLFSAAFGASLALGRMLVLQGALSAALSNILQALLITTGYACLLYWVVAALWHRLSAPRVSALHKGPTPRATFWLALIILLLGWLPVFIAYYPAIYAYDVTAQAAQCFTGQYDTRNPLGHTLYLKLFFMIGDALHNPTLGLGIGTLVQLLLAAVGLASGLALLRRMKIPFWACAAIAIYFAVCPVFSIISISTIKDALFGITFTLSVLHLYQFAMQYRQQLPWKADLCRGLGLMLFTLLWRYNAILAYGLGFVLAFIVCRVFRKRFFVGLTLGTMVLALVMTMGLARVMHATSGTGVYESFSLPAQQLRRAQQVATDPEHLEAIEACFLKSIPAEKGYVPTFGDIARYTLNTTVYGWNDPSIDIPVNPDQILFTWLRMAPRYPVAYLEAFLQTNRGSWYVDDISFAQIYAPPGNGIGYLVTTFNDTPDTYPVQRQQFWPALASFLDQLITDNTYQQIPILSTIMGTGFQAWLLLGITLLCILRRNRPLLGVCMIPLALWITLLLGPCTLVRYLYPIYLLNPLLFALLAYTSPVQPKSHLPSKPEASQQSAALAP